MVTKVLLVDDEESVTRLMKMTLEDSGKYEIKSTNRSTEALELVQWFDPDICVLDVIMPELSGLELAEQLRAHWGDNQKKIIFLTAAISKEDVSLQHDLIEGAPVLAKPVDADELIDKIDSLMST